ncbi:MAG: hypothetical protein VW268_03145 [Rhodospirillaceae bacterium]
MIRRIRLPLLALALMTVLSSCYLPARFDMEIEFDRRGYYKMIFAGYMVDMRLYNDLKSGKVKGPAEVEEVKKLQADIERDPSASDFSYIKQGYFRLKWQREGDLLKAKSVTFLRRNETFFALSFNKNTYAVNMVGRSLAESQKQRIVDAGLNMTGELRVITDTKVIGHNADQVKDFSARGLGAKVYVWRFPNIFRATPSMQITLR